MTSESEFSLTQAINFEPLRVKANASLEDVLTLLGQTKNSCVLVVEQQKLIGIYTERDVVRMTAEKQNFAGLTIADVMSKNVISITASEITDIFLALNLMRRNRIRHLPVLNEFQQLIGIVTPKTIRKVFKPVDMLRNRLVHELMETRVIQASPLTNVLDIALLMAKNRISCVVINNENTAKESYPIGIITELDIVRLRAKYVDFSCIQAKKVMSAPLKPIKKDNTLWLAHQRMEQEKIRRLVVIDSEGKLSGIITQSSLLQVLDPLEMQATINILQQTVNEQTLQLQDKNRLLEQEIKQCQIVRSVLSKNEIEYRTLAEKLKIANQQLQLLANSDGLTGLANRRYFDDYFQQQWKRLSREQKFLSLIMFDVDYFKNYNDTYGHLLGDECLRKIANVLKKVIKRPADLVARYGGEEFIILLPNTDLEGTIHLAEKINLDIESLDIPHCNSDVSHRVTVSLGLATAIPQLNILPPTLIAAADKMLYKAKSAGRNCIAFA
ncbi:MAG: diguanylate cyclase [Cyanobacteria bacterium P01_H01_bin.150]